MTAGAFKVVKTEAKIWVTFDVIGFHCYPEAPEEVAYLKSRHRHVFKFKVTVPVRDLNREIEFHMFKTWLQGLYSDNVLEADNKSCEMLANELADKVLEAYGVEEVEVDVSEDGECGAIVTVTEVR